MSDIPNPTTLAEAQAIIDRQHAEIEQLRRNAGDERFSRELRQTLSLVSSTSIIASPVSHSRLLEMIVEAAAQVLSAKAASLFLVDNQTQELIFEVALGQKAAEVKHFRIPLGHGIAGLVARSGQPMSISNARQDMRQASDIAQAIGYQPQSILCMPLFYDDQVIGVLELLDKEGAPSFGADDMETLNLFANQAAVAIEQSLTHRNLAALLSQLLASWQGVPDHQKNWLHAEAKNFTANLDSDNLYRETLELAQLVQQLAWRGSDELRLCKSILASVTQYLAQRPGYSGELGGLN